MPFDGTGFVPNEYLQQIDEIIDLIGTPDRWCKRNFRAPGGRYCLRGAIREVDRFETIRGIILETIQDTTGHAYRKIEAFNDDPQTSHQQVVEVLLRARDNIIAGRVTAAPRSALRHHRLHRWWAEMRYWFRL